MKLYNEYLFGKPILRGSYSYLNMHTCIHCNTCNTTKCPNHPFNIDKEYIFYMLCYKWRGDYL